MFSTKHFGCNKKCKLNKFNILKLFTRNTMIVLENLSLKKFKILDYLPETGWKVWHEDETLNGMFRLRPARHFVLGIRRRPWRCGELVRRPDGFRNIFRLQQHSARNTSAASRSSFGAFERERDAARIVPATSISEISRSNRNFNAHV